MTSQGVFWMTVGIAAFIAALFLVRKKNRAPTKLNLRGASQAGSSLPVAQMSGVVGNAPAAAKAPAVEVLSPETRAAQSLSPREKSLNAFFNYNGHMWDAYEILGLPAGAGPALVEQAYQKEFAKAKGEAQEFIQLAYQTIRAQRS